MILREKPILKDSKKYKIIYADPPWYFKSYSKKGEDRNATNHYPCMEFNDLLALNINDIAVVDCCLFPSHDPQRNYHLFYFF